MRHDPGGRAESGGTTSTSDTVLVGLMIIGGVIVAIGTASKIVVAFAIAILVGLVAHKLRHALPRSTTGEAGAAGGGGGDSSPGTPGAL